MGTSANWDVGISGAVLRCLVSNRFLSECSTTTDTLRTLSAPVAENGNQTEACRGFVRRRKTILASSAAGRWARTPSAGRSGPARLVFVRRRWQVCGVSLRGADEG